MTRPKIKDLMGLDMRISLYQTAMNNSGRNYEGRAVPVKKVADFASNFYKIAVKEIETLGELDLKQMEKTIIQAPTPKAVNHRDFRSLMKKARKTNGHSRKVRR